MKILKKLRTYLFRIKLLRVRNLKIGKNVTISKKNSFGEVKVEIENDVYLGPNFSVGGKGKFIIKNGTIIGPNCFIMTSNHNYKSDLLKSIPYDSNEDIYTNIIGENVWIGANVSIVPGVNIGEGCIIGMGSVVSKNLDECSIAAGNPIKTIKKRNTKVYKDLKNKDKIYMKLKNKS